MGNYNLSIKGNIMALKLDYTLPGSTTTVPDVYFRIDSTSYTNGNSVGIKGVYFGSQSDRENFKRPIGRKDFTVSGDDYDTYLSDDVLQVLGASLLINCYTYLKTLPEFSTATDA